MTSEAGPATFDPLADEYDDTFSNTVIGAMMRRAVARRFADLFPSGCRILELNCGTGVDAAALAQRGVHVVATDASAEMVRVTRDRAAAGGFSSLITPEVCAIEQLGDRFAGERFDGVLSDFGGLNCVADLHRAATALASITRPGARVLLCIMGPVVPWEWLWFLGHGQPRKAFRRLRRGGVDWHGLRIRYPSVRTTRQAFEPGFQVTRVWALGALIPPPYTEHVTGRAPRVLALLERIERRVERVRIAVRLADHYVIELERR